jgi:hypothetical protein
VTPDELGAAVAANTAAVAGVVDSVRAIVLWLTVLTLLFAAGKVVTLWLAWKEHAEIAELLRVNKEFAAIADMRRQESRDKLKAEIGETVKCSVMEAAAVLPLPSPSDPGTLPTVTVPEGGMVVKPEGHP